MASSVDKGNSKEIDIIASAKKVWAHKISLLIFLVVFSVLGVIVAVNTPKVYTASVVLAPEAQGTSVSGSLSDMASSFGIDLGNKQTVDAIYPEIYPLVVSSNDFVLGLFDVKVRTKNDPTQKKYIDHLKNDLKTPFWDVWKATIISKFKKKDDDEGGAAGAGGQPDQFELPKPVYDACDGIKNSIVCLVDKKTSIITISVSDQDPLVAAIVTDTIQHRLQDYINNYKTKKSRRDVAYYKKLMDETLVKYQKAQKEYADYADAHQDLSLQEYQSKQEDLENNMQLKYNTYTQMQTQYQAALAKLQQSKPAYTVLQKPTMPYKASSTPRFFICIVYFFIGIVLDSICVLFIYPLFKKKKKTVDGSEETLFESTETTPSASEDIPSTTNDDPSKADNASTTASGDNKTDSAEA